jgi:hypothetical protein
MQNATTARHHQQLEQVVDRSFVRAERRRLAGVKRRLLGDPKLNQEPAVHRFIAAEEQRVQELEISRSRALEQRSRG